MCYNLGMYLGMLEAHMGEYTVPESIRRYKPKGTMVKRISGHYYVYLRVKSWRTTKGRNNPYAFEKKPETYAAFSGIEASGSIWAERIKRGISFWA